MAGKRRAATPPNLHGFLVRVKTPDGRTLDGVAFSATQRDAEERAARAWAREGYVVESVTRLADDVADRLRKTGRLVGVGARKGRNPGAYAHKRLRRPSRFVPGSFRLTKKRKGVRVVVGKLRGERRRVKRGRRKGRAVLTPQAILKAKRRNPAQPGEGPGQNIRNALASLMAERDLLKMGKGECDPKELYEWYGQIIARLTVALKQVESGRLGNPALAVFGANPGKAAGILSNDVQAVLYRHATDGQDYVHPFGNGVRVVNKRDGSTVIRAKATARSGVRATLLRDGSVLLRHPTKSLWGDF